MKEELEICVRAKESFNEVYKKMLNLGFHIQEDFILKDIYMVPNDISISLENENLIFFHKNHTPLYFYCIKSQTQSPTY